MRRIVEICALISREIHVCDLKNVVKYIKIFALFARFTELLDPNVQILKSC